mgnify:CR=1 FL=1
MITEKELRVLIRPTSLMYFLAIAKCSRFHFTSKRFCSLVFISGTEWRIFLKVWLSKASKQYSPLNCRIQWYSHPKRHLQGCYNISLRWEFVNAMNFMKLICESQPKNMLRLTYQQQHVLVFWGLLHGSEIREKTVANEGIWYYYMLILAKSKNTKRADYWSNQQIWKAYAYFLGNWFAQT